MIWKRGRDARRVVRRGVGFVFPVAGGAVVARAQRERGGTVGFGRPCACLGSRDVREVLGFVFPPQIPRLTRGDARQTWPTSPSVPWVRFSNRAQAIRPGQMLTLGSFFPGDIRGRRAGV